MTMRRLLAALAFSLAAVPALAQRPQMPCSVEDVLRIDGDQQRQLHIRVPIDTNGARDRYPVLYVLDGDDNMLHTLAAVEMLARNGEIPDMVVVSVTSRFRARDYTPGDNGQSNAFIKFIETDMFPFIDRTYRAQPYRVLVADDLGALFALHAFAKRPDLFNATIAINPRLTSENGIVLAELEKTLRENKEIRHTLYVAGARGGDDAGIARLKALLGTSTARQFAWSMGMIDKPDRPMQSLAGVPDGLISIFSDWSAPRDETGRLKGDLAGLEAHYKAFGARHGIDAQVPEAIVDELGKQYLAEGKNADAIRTLSHNCDIRPLSAQAFNSLGEAYEKIGELQNAVDALVKATLLGPRVKDPKTAFYEQNRNRAQRALAQKKKE